MANYEEKRDQPGVYTAEELKVLVLNKIREVTEPGNAWIVKGETEEGDDITVVYNYPMADIVNVSIGTGDWFIIGSKFGLRSPEVVSDDDPNSLLAAQRYAGIIASATFKPIA